MAPGTSAHGSTPIGMKVPNERAETAILQARRPSINGSATGGGLIVARCFAGPAAAANH
jgi:hypothetical protein